MEARGEGIEPRVEALSCGIERTVVCIEDGETAARLSRPMGTYVTLSCPQELTIDLTTREAISAALAALTCVSTSVQ